MLKRIFIALISTLAISTAAQAKTPLEEQIDRQVQPLIDAEAIVGCVVGVLKDGETHFFGYGEVELGGGQKPDERTIYEIGGVTNVFTGTLLAGMSLRDEVSIDGPIEDYLPKGVSAPEKDGQPITLRRLALHTSGLPRLPNNRPESNRKDPYADYTLELAYTFLDGHRLRRTPGEKEQYSNYGMGLLGLVLAERARLSYESLMVERIAEPLGMSDTRITLSDEQQRRLAPPYDEDLEPGHPWSFDALAGCGALRSTAADLLKLAAAAIGDGDQPAHRALRLAMEDHSERADRVSGLGWVIAPGGDRWHNGGTGGYDSFLHVWPDLEQATVLLINTDTDSDFSDRLGVNIARVVSGQDVDPLEVPEKTASKADTLLIIVAAVVVLMIFEGGAQLQLLFTRNR